ncbi:peptidase S33 [Nakamurella silvestris]|nr:peptidase S33 [Nakamurella silvestris]
MTTGTAERSTMSRTERQELRSRQSRRRRRIAWIVALVVVLLAGSGVYVVWYTSVLGLKEISVSGVDGAVEKAVLAAAPPADGSPMIKIDLAAVRRDVLEVPQVAGASVSRAWPGSLVIQVTPRVPVAVVSANGALWLLDAAGTPYVTTPTVPKGLLTLRLATPGAGDPATLAGLAVAGDLPPDIAAKVASISARTQYDISLELKDGRTVQWGDPTKGARKAQVLGPLLAQPGTRFDISDPELVTAG